MHEDAVAAGNLVVTMGDVRRDGIAHAIDRALDHVAHCDALVIDCDIDVIDRVAISRRARARGRAGWRSHDFFAAVRRLASDPRVRVIDLTEWDPPLDATDLSALTAARWVAECLARLRAALSSAIASVARAGDVSGCSGEGDPTMAFDPEAPRPRSTSTASARRRWPRRKPIRSATTGCSCGAWSSAAIVTWLIVRSGVLDELDAKLGPRRLALKAFVVSGAYFLVSAILTVPWTIYSEWWRERDYGRTAQPLGDFLGQMSLAVVITTLIAAVFMIGVYALIRHAGRSWWIWSGGLTAIGLAFVFLVSPVLIEPLFNTYEPVPAGAGAQRPRRNGGQGAHPRRPHLHVQRLAPVEQFHRQCLRHRQLGARRHLRRRAEAGVAG